MDKQAIYEAEPPKQGKDETNLQAHGKVHSMPSFKEYRHSSTLRYKLVEFIYLRLHLLILMKKESVLRMITSVSARREQQCMNGEPEIKHNSIFISSLPEPRLETLFHTDFILLRGPFL